MAEALDIVITQALEREDYAICVQIRTIVFVVGQNVPAAREVDEFESRCSFYLARQKGQPLGTVRWRRYEDRSAKIERLAVLQQARGKQIGQRLMQHVEKEILKLDDIEKLVLHSQDDAIPFYTALGFEVVGKGFLDAAIPHHSMVKACRR